MARYSENKRSDIGLDPSSELSHSERKAKVKATIQEAKQLREKGDYDQGIDQLVEVLQLDVLKDRIYYRLGNLYFDAGDLDRAEYAYKRAIDENDQHVNAQHNLAVVYRKQGKIGKSVKQKKKAHKIKARNPPDVDLTDQQRKKLKGFALNSVVVFLLIVGGIAGIVYLVVRFL